MEPTNGLSGLRIALLIDFDNVVLGLDEPGFDVELVVNALRERGTIVLGRAYGDWYRHNRHRRKLMEQGLELVETPAFGPVIKNSADIRIALDGYEVAMTQSHIDTFAIVSGDSDFLPLVKKLQALGRRVLVICGNRFTSDMLRRNCNEFISYENLLAQSVGATEDATTIEGAFALLHRAMAALRERGSEIRGSTLKQMMLQLNPVFSERTFGCPQFRQFLDKAVAQNLIKLGARDRNSGEFFVFLPEEDETQTPASNGTPKPSEVRSGREIRTHRERERRREEQKTAAPAESEVAIQVEGELTEVSELEVASESNESAASETGTSSAPDLLVALEEHGVARNELLSRGLRPGKRRFSGRTKSVEIVEVPELPAPVQIAAPESEVTATGSEAAEATTESAGERSRSRSRARRRRKPETPADNSITEAIETAIELVAESGDGVEVATAQSEEVANIAAGTTDEPTAEVALGETVPSEIGTSPAEVVAEADMPAVTAVATEEAPAAPAKKLRSRTRTKKAATPKAAAKAAAPDQDGDTSEVASTEIETPEVVTAEPDTAEVAPVETAAPEVASTEEVIEGTTQTEASAEAAERADAKPKAPRRRAVRTRKATE